MNDKHPDKLKELVKNKYNNIALRSSEGQKVSCCEPAGCCGSSGETSPDPGFYSTIMSESYDRLEGYHPDADLKLGCGIPIEFAGLKPGQSVLDLGSGSGNDLFVARSAVGNTGQLTGLDFSEAMNQKARLNAQKLAYKNMEFISGDIDNMPFDNNRFDVVLSNCVLNLVPDKNKAFSEIYRVLKPGGHFSISDIVLGGDLPESIRKVAEAYVGCVSGATQKNIYLKIVKDIGFTDIAIKKERKITIPGEWFKQVLDNQKPDLFHPDTFRIISITLTGQKR